MRSLIIVFNCLFSYIANLIIASVQISRREWAINRISLRIKSLRTLVEKFAIRNYILAIKIGPTVHVLDSQAQYMHKM